MILPKPVKFLHTLHRKNDKTPFVFHIMQHDETVKTTLFTFTYKRDALLLGNVFELHNKVHGKYPNNHFTHEKPLDITLDTNEVIDFTRPLKDIVISDNPEEDIFDFCAYSNMDLMIIDNLEDSPSVKIIKFEVPLDLLKQKFEENFK